MRQLISLLLLLFATSVHAQCDLTQKYSDKQLFEVYIIGQDEIKDGIGIDGICSISGPFTEMISNMELVYTRDAKEGKKLCRDAEKYFKKNDYDIVTKGSEEGMTLIYCQKQLDSKIWSTAVVGHVKANQDHPDTWYFVIFTGANILNPMSYSNYFEDLE